MSREEDRGLLRTLWSIATGLMLVAFGAAAVQWGCGSGISDKIYANSDYCSAGCADCKWTKPTNNADTTSVDGSQAFNPMVALNALGEGVLMWKQSDLSVVPHILSAELSGGVWDLPDSVELPKRSSGDTVITPPRVAINSKGLAVSVWLENSTENQVFMAERLNGLWSAATKISVSGTPASEPDLALSDSGEAIIVWRQDDSLTDSRIVYARRHGGTWEIPTSITSGDSIDNNHMISADVVDSNLPKAAIDPKGDAVVAWREIAPTSRMKFAELISGTWGSIQFSVDLGAVLDIAVTMDDLGTAEIAYFQNNGSQNLFIASRDELGGWTLPSGADSKFTAASPANLSFGRDGSGRITLVWRSNSVVDRVFSLEGTPGNWPSATLLHAVSSAISPASEVSLSVSPGGDAVLAWIQFNSAVDNSRAMVIQRINGTWHPTLPDPDTDFISIAGTDAEQISAAIDCSGRASVVWSQPGASFNQIYRAEFR